MFADWMYMGARDNNEYVYYLYFSMIGLSIEDISKSRQREILLFQNSIQQGTGPAKFLYLQCRKS